jgi:hypothetical protein
MHHKHLRHKKYFQKETHWDEPTKRFNLKGQIQNEIKSSYLGHLGVGLI